MTKSRRIKPLHVTHKLAQPLTFDYFAYIDYTRGESIASE